MIYLWIKGLHIGATLIFAGGLMLLAVVTSGLMWVHGVLLPQDRRIVNAVLLWDRRVTAPALGVVWATGLGLAVWGGWFGQAWLTGKIVLVVALSALHGVLSATLRRQQENASASKSSWQRHSPAVVAVGLLVIAVLVALKP